MNMQHPAKFEEAQLAISQQNIVQQASGLSKNLVTPIVSLSCAKLPWDDLTSQHCEGRILLFLGILRRGIESCLLFRDPASSS